MFAVGYGLQAAISTLSVVTTVLRRPTALRDTLFSRLNLKLAAFMGGYSAIFRVSYSSLTRPLSAAKRLELHSSVM